MDTLIKLVKKLLTVPKRYALVLTIIFAAAICIYSTTPGILVSGDTFEFNHVAFNICSITFDQPADVESYSIYKIQSDGKYKLEFATPLRSRMSVLVITNSAIRQNNQLITPGETNHVIIKFLPGYRIKINSLAIDNNPVKLKEFAKHNTIGNSEYSRVRNMRDFISALISRFNETVSNWILTMLSVGILLLILFVMPIAIKLFLYSDKKLHSSILKGAQRLDIKNNEDVQEHSNTLNAMAWDNYAEKWISANDSFRFLQMLGPALGFILTVSSLISSLNPALHHAKDLSAFLTGLYVAMVATFLGLLLRLIALFGMKFNDQLRDRVAAILDK